MAYSPREHVIHTGAGGELIGTTFTDIDTMVASLCAADRAVVHFHGGLVDEQGGLKTAERLYRTYDAAGARPVFFVWRSGLGETIVDDLRRIFDEDVFKRLLQTVVRYAVGKVRQSTGDRAAGVLSVPDPMSANRELHRRTRDEEPYGEISAGPEVAELDDLEGAQLEAELTGDSVLQNELASILAWHTGTTDTAARGVYVAEPKPSLMSSDVLDELAKDDIGARGVGSALVLAKKAVAVLLRTIKRFRGGTAHGIYATAVEELLRGLYLAAAGGTVWNAMKAKTLDTFRDVDPPHGGAYFLDRLAEQLRTQAAEGMPLPQITLVGHSTGAIFIDNLIGAAVRRRADFPPGFAFHNVVFLAPACTGDSFGQTLAYADLVGTFRMFTMDDASERADHLVGGFYPRSLLHLIAGVLERDGRGRSAYQPIAGMARYLAGPMLSDPPEGLAAVRDFIAADPTRLVTSPSPADAGVGRRSGALSHTSFDEDEMVLDSITAMIRGAG